MQSVDMIGACDATCGVCGVWRQCVNMTGHRDESCENTSYN